MEIVAIKLAQGVVSELGPVRNCEIGKGRILSTAGNSNRGRTDPNQATARWHLAAGRERKGRGERCLARGSAKERREKSNECEMGGKKREATETDYRVDWQGGKSAAGGEGERGRELTAALPAAAMMKKVLLPESRTTRNQMNQSHQRSQSWTGIRGFSLSHPTVEPAHICVSAWWALCCDCVGFRSRMLLAGQPSPAPTHSRHHSPPPP